MSRYLRFARAQWDRVLGWILVAAGGGLVVSGALNVSRAGDQLDQLSFLASGPAIGLFLLGVGAVLLLTADLRDEWSKLDEVARLLRRSSDSGPPDVEPPDRQVDLRVAPAGVTAMVVAGFGVVGGALGARQSMERASAARWTGLSGASLALAVAAAVAVYLRSRRHVSGRLVEVDEALAASRDRADGDVADGRRYAVAGSPLYHRAGCDLLAFAEAVPIPAAGAAGAALEACPLCR